MTEVYRSIFAPLASLDEVNIIAANYEGFENLLRRELTTDVNGAPPATHKGGAGNLPEELVSELENVPNIFISSSYWSTAIVEAGLHTVVEEI